MARLTPFASDPLSFLTFLGGVGSDETQGLLVNRRGGLTVVGNSYGLLFPRTPNAPDLGPATGSHADSPVLVDLDVNGDVVYSNFIFSRLNHGEPYGIAVDADGRQYVSGTTSSGTFPVGSCAIDVAAVGYDAYLTRLMPRQTEPLLTWTAPPDLTYGGALGSQQYQVLADVDGQFQYEPAVGTILPAGEHALSVTFVPDDQSRYRSVTAQAVVRVNKAVPVIAWSPAGPLVIGTPLGTAQLNAAATAAGTFSHALAAGTILPLGSHQLTVTFQPTDAANYVQASGQAGLVVAYGVCLQYDPAKTKKAGSTIPIKLQACNAAGVNLSSPGGVPVAVGIVRTGDDVVGEAESPCLTTTCSGRAPTRSRRLARQRRQDDPTVESVNQEPIAL